MDGKYGLKFLKTVTLNFILPEPETRYVCALIQVHLKSFVVYKLL